MCMGFSGNIIKEKKNKEKLDEMGPMTMMTKTKKKVKTNAHSVARWLDYYLGRGDF